MAKSSGGNELKNILSSLAEKADENPDKIAFIFPKKDTLEADYDQITFKELEEKSSRAANFLWRHGFHSGVVTLVLVKPSIDFVILLYGMLKTGAVPLLLPSLNIRSRSGRRELRKILKRANPRGIIGSTFSLIVSKFFLLSNKPQRELKFSKLKKHFSNHLSPKSFKINSDLDWGKTSAFVKYTTGTTGPAKGVIYTHSMLHSHLKVLHSQGLTDRDIFYGRGGTLLVHPILGITSIVNMSSPKQTTGIDIVLACKKWKATTVFLSPPSAINLAGYIATEPQSENHKMLPTVRRLYVGGESVAAKVAEIIEPHLSDDRPSDGGFHLVYGATEGFPLCYAPYSTIRETEHHTSSGRGVCLGREAIDVKLRILSYDSSAEFNDLPIMKKSDLISQIPIGEIAVNGPVVYSCLIGEDEDAFGGQLSWAIDNTDQTKWHRTGDLGYRDEEGKIWLVGRKSHSVELVDGSSLYTKQIEEFFNSNIGIRTALVQGLQNDTPILLVEKSNKNWSKTKSLIIEQLPNLSELHGKNLKLEIMLFGEEFPVDKGHEAKIEREKLNSWVVNKLQNSTP